jgi:hypothetical protein
MGPTIARRLGAPDEPVAGKQNSCGSGIPTSAPSLLANQRFDYGKPNFRPSVTTSGIRTQADKGP